MKSELRRGRPVTAESPHPSSAATGRQKAAMAGRAVRVVALLACAALAAWGIPRNPTVREWRLSRMGLAEFKRNFRRGENDPVFLYHYGTRLIEKGFPAAADPILRRSVGLDPDSARARDRWAQALLASGLTTAAFGELREFAGTHPNDPQAHLILGKFYATQRSMRRAAEEFSRTVELDPRLADGWAYLATARDALGAHDQALEAIERALSIRDTKPSDVLEHASLLAFLNRGDEARREYERLLTLAPHWPAAHREYASWLGQTGKPADLERSRAEALRAITLDAGDAGAQLLYGRASFQLGKLDDAEKALLQGAKLDADNPAPAQELAALYRQSQRATQAEHWQQEYARRQSDAAQLSLLMAQVRANPANPALHRRLARLQGRHGDIAGCVHNYAMASGCALDSPIALVPAASALTEGGHAADALPLALRAVQVADSNPAAHEVLGDALLGTGKPDLARPEYEKTIQWLPQRTQILKQRLAKFYADRAAHPSQAEIAYRKARAIELSRFGPKRIIPQVEALAAQAVNLEPTNAKYLWYLLRVQMALRKDDAAIATANKLVLIAPGDGRAHARLAVLLVDRLQQPNGPQAAEIEAHLKAAASEPSTIATRRYVTGLLALARKQTKVAIKDLSEAIRLDPVADVTYYKLALAQRAAGDVVAAEKTMSEYRRRQDLKRQEMALLGDIGQHPDNPKLYDHAVQFYSRLGLQAEASAVRAEANRRFGRLKPHTPATNTP